MKELAEKEQHGKIAGLRKQLLFYRIFVVILLLCIATGITAHIREWILNNASELGLSFAEKKAPYSKEVKKIIEPLRYSMFESLLRPDVYLSLDFAGKTWRIHNLYRFDDEGNVILEDGRYGSCGELAAYVYQKIRPLLGERYKIEFVGAGGLGYFLKPRTSHYVLQITDYSNSVFVPNVYILDPSFRRYNSIDKLNDYAFFENIDPDYFINNTGPDAVNGIGENVSLMIKQQHIIGLMVGAVAENNKFDNDNFGMLLTATKRYEYSNRLIFGFRKIEGKTQIFEDKPLADRLLKDKEYGRIKEKLTAAFQKISENQ